MWCSSGSVSCLTQLGSRQPGESMYFCHANIGWSTASAVRPKCYLWLKENHVIGLNCYVMWWRVVAGVGGCIFASSWDGVMRSSVSLVTGVMSAAWVTWCDAVRVIMQWSQLSALTTTRDLGLRGMHSVSGRCHAMPSYLQTAVWTLYWLWMSSLMFDFSFQVCILYNGCRGLHNFLYEAAIKTQTIND